ARGEPHAVGDHLDCLAVRVPQDRSDGHPVGVGLGDHVVPLQRLQQECGQGVDRRVEVHDIPCRYACLAHLPCCGDEGVVLLAVVDTHRTLPTSGVYASRSCDFPFCSRQRPYATATAAETANTATATITPSIHVTAGPPRTRS